MLEIDGDVGGGDLKGWKGEKGRGVLEGNGGGGSKRRS